MDATKPISIQIREINKMWRELWWQMAGGVKSEYDRIKLTPVFEFWGIFDMWKADIKKQRDNLKNQNSKRNGKR